MPKVGIILPTLNEKSNLQKLLPEIIGLHPEAHIIIVDDNSTDGTHEYFASNFKNISNVEMIIRNQRMGIGSAHKFGLRRGIELGCDYLVTLDADGTHNPTDIQKLLMLNLSFDVVLGSRYKIGGAVRNWSLFRKLLTQAGHQATRLFFGSSLDMSSGMRSYDVRKIPIRAFESHCPDDYAFFFTSVLVLLKKNLSVGEQSIVLANRGFGDSKMTPRLMFQGVKFLFLYGFRIKRIRI